MPFDDTDQNEGGGDSGGRDYHNPPSELIDRCVAGIDVAIESQGYCGVCGVRSVSVAGLAKVVGSLSAKYVVMDNEKYPVEAIKRALDEVLENIAIMSMEEYHRHYAAYMEEKNDKE